MKYPCLTTQHSAFIRVLLVFCVLLGASTSFAEQAAVRSYDNPALSIGQSFLARYGKRCLVFMPTHVVNEANAQPSLLKMGKKPLLGVSQDMIALGDVSDDVSMGSVQGEIAQDCGSSMSLLSRAVDKHVEKTGLATLRWVNFDGTQGNIAVSVLDHGDANLMRIQPASNKQQIRKGMSGSVLWANGHPVGILLSVNAARGRATVFRMDALLARAEQALRGNSGVRASVKPSMQNSGSDNLLALDQGAAVTAWSVMAVSPQKQAINLLDPSAQQTWEVAVERWPVSVELDLAGEKQILSRLVIEAAAVGDLANLPRRVTVLFNLSTSSKNWRTFSTVDLHFDENQRAEIRFPETWVRELRLEFFGKKDQKTIELSGVRAYKK